MSVMWRIDKVSLQSRDNIFYQMHRLCIITSAYFRHRAIYWPAYNSVLASVCVEA
jgi:hypothetical protein